MSRQVAAILVASGAMLGLSAPNVNAFVPVPKSIVVPASTSLPVGKRTTPPYGHLVFCNKYPNECRSGGSGTITLTKQKWDQLRSVNVSVNRSIREKHDSGGTLADTWSVAPSSGDCEDFALTKRSKLVRSGWPARALSVAVVEAPGRGTHAVLVVRTDHGDFVLDNLRADILPWRNVGYQFAKVQSDENPKAWIEF